MEMLDEVIETTLSPDGTATSKRLISDEETLAEMEFMRLQVEYAKNEIRWRTRSDYKAMEKSHAAEEKLCRAIMDGWADRETIARCYNQYRLRLLYKHKAEA